MIYMLTMCCATTLIKSQWLPCVLTVMMNYAVMPQFGTFSLSWSSVFALSAPVRRRAVGKVPPRIRLAILCESILSFFALPPWMAFMYRAWPKTNQILLSSQKSAIQYQANMHSYDSKDQAENMADYIRTKFFRFMVGLLKNTQDTTKDRFTFVPQLPMTKTWTDDKLYKHFGLTQDEIAFIESMVRPMPACVDDADREVERE